MSKKVLIVEDDRLLSIVLSKMASAMGYDVLATCPGGRHAIECAECLNPDLVIMDIMLADDISGIDAMKKIRTLSDVPVVYVTAHSDSRIKSIATEVDNSAFLTKPVKIEQLQQAIDTVQFAA
jgi:CheY-like chemotaxis protein